MAMELCFFVLLPLVVVLVMMTQWSKKKEKKKKLPPGPPSYPIIGNLLWLSNSVLDLDNVLRGLFRTYGPIVTVRIGSRLAIFISDRSIAHKALVELGSSFSSRPAPLPANRFLGNQHLISTAAYGPLWRLLRRNLISEILSPSRVKLYAPGRNWVLTVLLDDLRRGGSDVVVPMQSFGFAMFCLLVLMCFGEKLDERSIREIETVHRELLVYSTLYLKVLNFFPSVSRYVFKNRLQTAQRMLRKQTEICLPLIKARRQHMRKKNFADDDDDGGGERYVYSYLDSLLEMTLAEDGGRMLTEDEMVGLCAEFLNAGTDTTSTSLQWIMAELVRNQQVQRKLADEIDAVVAGDEESLREEELHRLPYLKAVVLEGLRRHPPSHYVLPHAMSEQVEFEGYVIPKKATVNFMFIEVQWSEKVWKDPMEFKPERFLDENGCLERVDITGSKDIKMTPFGVGRRICPGLALAMLHLEYFVGNLVREFEWKAVEGEEVDMSEKPEFTVVMKNPLRARLIPRR